MILNIGRATVVVAAAGAVATLLALAAGDAVAATSGGIDYSTKVTVSAHRGGAQQWPQNSLEAFGESLNAGYGEIEADAWLTADGVPVVHHDAAMTAPRCAGPYLDQPIHSLTLDQVRQMTCDDQPVPTEQELLDLIAKSSNQHTVLRLECKTPGGQTAEEARAAAGTVGGLVVTAGLTDRAIMQDFDWNGIAGFHDASPRLRVSALIDEPTPAAAVRARNLGAYDLSFEAKYSTALINTYVASLGLVPTMWSVDPTPTSPGPISASAAAKVRTTARTLAADGARVLIVNNPDVVIDALSTPIAFGQPWHNWLDTVMKPIRTTSTSGTYAIGPKAPSPLGTQWYRLSLRQSTLPTARVLVVPDGYPNSYGKYYTLPKGGTVRLTGLVGVDGNLRVVAPSSLPQSRIRLVREGYYPVQTS